MDQTLPRNDSNERQIGNDRENPTTPLANPHPRPLQGLARRLLCIPDHAEIVDTLSAVSTIFRQPMYILTARGFVSQANVLSIPFEQPMIYNGPGKILYLSGWFHPRLRYTGVGIPFSLTNGVLHVSLPHLGVPQGPTIASKLYALGPVEVDVLFICGPWSTMEPDTSGGPSVPVRMEVSV